MTVLPLLERRREDGQRRRQGERVAEPLPETGRDEGGRALGQPAEQRGDGDEQDAADEHPPAAEQVGGAAAEEHEAAVR